MIPNLFIVSSSGEVLIEKQWVGKTKRQICDVYWEEVVKAGSREEVVPVVVTPKQLIVQVVRGDLTFLVALAKETPVLFLHELLHAIIDLLSQYFKIVSETTIRENFSTILQLLDEMIDGGYPFTTESNQLKEMIIPPSLARRVFQNVTGEFAVRGDLPGGALTKIPWRKSDVKYVTNEIYFDVIESMDCIISSSQQVIHSTVSGEIRCTCRLSGMPDLTLSFTRPQLLEDVSLHRCVRINRFQREKVISFVPPDGVFKLLTFRAESGGMAPISVKPTVTFRPGQGKFHIMVGQKVAADKAVTDVVIIIPMPKMTRATQLNANVGLVKYDAISKICRWDIGKMPKDMTPVLDGNVTFPLDECPEESPVLRAEFQCKTYSACGLKVDGLAIRNVNYKPFKGVRAVTQAGKFFQIRT